jgi:hypothetical protein
MRNDKWGLGRRDVLVLVRRNWRVASSWKNDSEMGRFTWMGN